MTAPQLLRLSADLDERVLLELGATRVEEVREGGELVGYDVLPLDLNLAGYDAAAAAVLARVKARLKAGIDGAAEAERGRYITPGAGQALTYQRKLEEARRLVALIDEEEIDAAEFPMLSATVGIDGDTLDDVAALVISMDAAWAMIGAAIETARMVAKRAIDAAEDEVAARAVVPAWPAPPEE